ncbi:MAG: class I SAM-dependent methyltransferase [Planctomycetes bacterium]|nr:class I SAM-dependent methyltransferase [Planctomycetota bacterium]
MTFPLTDELMEYVRAAHPRSLRGVEEARQAGGDDFGPVVEMFLTWLTAVRGRQGIVQAVDEFVKFSTEVNLAQARYEADGHYMHKSFAELLADHYSSREAMDDYLWGVFLTNVLWAHHFEICLFYRNRFLAKLPGAEAKIVEIAPGHGGWGVWALHRLAKSRLEGFDISPSSITIAGSVSAAAGVGGRARYELKDALDLAKAPPESADAVINCFLAEHLERPAKLFEVIARLLKPDGRAFVAAGLTAAQVDHIYEFRRESELVKLAEDAGLRMTESFVGSPRRTLPKAKFLPRSMALILAKRKGEFL